MRYIMSRLVFVFCLMLALPAKAISPKEMQELVSYLYTTKASHKTLAHTLPPANTETGKARMVIATSRSTYTIEHTGQAVMVGGKPVPHLTIWERPKGTTDTTQRLRMTDYFVNGSVEYAYYGDIEGNTDTKRYNDRTGIAGESHGMTLKQQWQTSYTQAVHDILRHLKQ